MTETTKRAKLPMTVVGNVKTGLVSTNFGRTRLTYQIRDHHAGFQKVTLDPASITARVETADEASKHMKAGRVGGGLVAGAILLGPLGAAIGGGLGAAARKQYTDKYLIIETAEGEVYSALLKGRSDYVGATKFCEKYNAITA